MTCDEIERNEIAEQYVHGRLDEEASVSFETHYFDCARCLDRVEQLESAREALLADTRQPGRRMWRIAGGLAAAALVVLAVRVFQESAAPGPGEQQPPMAGPTADQRGATRPTDLQSLGAIDPPPYTPPRLRASSTESRRLFSTAMAAYDRQDYSAAITGLEKAVGADPELVAARFFLAVSYLQLDRRGEAMPHLDEIVGRGESPYLEDAHFFRAKLLIRDGNLDAARRELRTVVALDGERRTEAAGLLSKLP